MEQSTLAETAKGKVMPQFCGSACASSGLGLMLLEADLMQLQAAFLSADVDVADTRADAPAQHAAGGFPLPFTR